MSSMPPCRGDSRKRLPNSRLADYDTRVFTDQEEANINFRSSLPKSPKAPRYVRAPDEFSQSHKETPLYSSDLRCLDLTYQQLDQPIFAKKSVVQPVTPEEEQTTETETAGDVKDVKEMLKKLEELVLDVKITQEKILSKLNQTEMDTAKKREVLKNVTNLQDLQIIEEMAKEESPRLTARMSLYKSPYEYLENLASFEFWAFQVKKYKDLCERCPYWVDLMKNEFGKVNGIVSQGGRAIAESSMREIIRRAPDRIRTRERRREVAAAKGKVQPTATYPE